MSKSNSEFIERDEVSMEQLKSEAKEIIQRHAHYFAEYYTQFREIYQNGYGWPEIDPLRWEICLCMFSGLFQAAMTLTNHFLESLLKYALIVDDRIKKIKAESEQSRQSVADHFRGVYAEGFKKFGELDLGDTINRACSARLITKEQKEQLHVLREVFRNAWNHADKAKTFGGTEMPVTGLHLGNDGIEIEPTEMVNVASFILGQGIVQAQIAEQETPKYFKYVDGPARQICRKLFGDNP